jgi:hypothetical protein
VQFSPKIDGFFKAELKLVFYDVRLSSRFVVRRRLQGIAGSIEDHKLFDGLGHKLFDGIEEEIDEEPVNIRYEPPPTVILLRQPDGRHKQRLPDYDVDPIVQQVVNNPTAVHPYDREARRLVTKLRPGKLTDVTYAKYFQALLNVEDGQQQCVP